MVVDGPSDLRKQIALGKRLLGLDVGEKTIGVALSDSTWKIASPLTTITRKKFTKDAQEIRHIIEEESVGGMVIGLPINMNGTEGPKCQSVRQFARNFLKIAEIPILFWDERLSTVAVTGTLLESNSSRQKRKKVVDKMAACYILQSALDRINSS